MVAAVDVLVPTYNRPTALAATLATLIGQTCTDFSVVVSDQSADCDGLRCPEVQAVVRVLRKQGHVVAEHHHVPRRGVAEHRQFLLDAATAPLVLFLDDDVLLEPDVIARLTMAMERARCGFIGAFVEAPSALWSDSPLDELGADVTIELWDGPVVPEVVHPGGPGWDRRRLHWSAHPTKLAARLGVTRDALVLYKVAWVGGCVLYDTAKLRAAGGFSFWDRLPAHAVGEDAQAQLQVMARYGGAALLPSGAWHQEAPTTMPYRSVDAPHALRLPGA